MQREHIEEQKTTRLSQVLHGLPYPVNKAELLEYVRSKTPDSASLEELTKLPPITFRKESEIFEALRIFVEQNHKTEEKIPEKISLPEDTDIPQSALVIAASHQGMRVYIIEGTVMMLANSLFVPRYRYSDDEGHFKSRTTAGAVRSGSPREYKQQFVIQEFLKQTKSYFSKLVPEDFDVVYLYAPAYMKNTLLKYFPRELLKKIIHVAQRNLYHEHPHTLIKGIQTYLEALKAKQNPAPQQFRYQ